MEALPVTEPDSREIAPPNRDGRLSAADLETLAEAVAALERSTLAGRLSNLAGKPLELMGHALPQAARDAITQAVEAALKVALRVATTSLPSAASSPDRPTGGGRLHTVLAAASGALGGAHGSDIDLRRRLHDRYSAVTLFAGGDRGGEVHDPLLEQAEAVVVDRDQDVAELRLLVGGSQRDHRGPLREAAGLDDLDDRGGVAHLLGVELLVDDGLRGPTRPASGAVGCRRDGDDRDGEQDGVDPALARSEHRDDGGADEGGCEQHPTRGATGHPRQSR